LNMKIPRWSPKKSKAQAMVEFAIALPVLMLLLYGLLEAGRLLFMYSTVVTASRQAVRYGSATGQNTSGTPRYQDCAGIRASAQRVAYLGPFDSVTIQHDSGPSTSATTYCSGATDTWKPSDSNADRISVTVSEQFQPIVPKIVPFLTRTITATSARTILVSVAIVVEQPPQIVVQDETSTEIDFANPNPSEISQSVTVQVTVTDQDDPTFTPTGEVLVDAGGGITCTITLNGNGWGTCTLVFDTAGMYTITADYLGDDEHLASSDTEPHEVKKAATVTVIESVNPSPSIKNQDVVVAVRVTGGSTTPTGTVVIDAGGNRQCTITLSNGVGSCTLNFNQTGTYPIKADYSGDSIHDISSDTQNHQVLAGTATPTNTPGPTAIPSATRTPANTATPSTPTMTPTAVPVCLAGGSNITHGPITKSGNTMTMTVTNPYLYPLTIGSGIVTWNDDKGHQTGSDKTLSLRDITIGSTQVWIGSTSNTSSQPWSGIVAVMPAKSTITLTFTFHQSYDNLDATERIIFTIITNGCNNLQIDSKF
jgi:Flp pilus assembly protein TadG